MSRECGAFANVGANGWSGDFGTSGGRSRLRADELTDIDRDRIERLGSVRRECLDHVVVSSERHLLEMLIDYCGYYSEARTHQSIGQLVPIGSSNAAAGDGAVIVRPVLNGLHRDYRRAA